MSGEPAHGVAPAGSEEGSATVLVVAAVGVLTIVLGAALALVSVVREVHAARTAADLSALAAARPLVTGGQADCAEARAVAAANAAVLRSCQALPDGSVETAVVRPRLGVGGWLVGLADPSARARAGPVASRVPHPSSPGADRAAAPVRDAWAVCRVVQARRLSGVSSGRVPSTRVSYPVVRRPS